MGKSLSLKIISDNFLLPAGLENMKRTLTFDQVKNPGINILKNLMAAMQAKFHEIFLQRAINSIPTVEKNVQELFAYLANRFDAFISELPPSKLREHE